MRRWVGAVIAIVALALVCGVCHAQRGGGFGGGRSGSFGGGRSGGFGGGGFRGGGSFGGSFRGGSRGPTFVPVGVGGRYSGASDPALALIVLGIVIVAIVAPGVATWWAGRCAVVEVCVRLKRGPRYVSRLAGMLSDADFSTPSGKATALHRFGKLFDPEDVVDAFVRVPTRLSSARQGGIQAEETARHLMERVGIAPDSVNVSDQPGYGVKVEGAPRAGRTSPSDACLAFGVLAARRSALRTVKAGGTDDALAALGSFAPVKGRDIAGLYLFFTPSEGENLDPAAADGLFLDLKAETERGRPANAAA